MTQRARSVPDRQGSGPHTHLLREYLSTLSYRFRHAVDDAPDGFGTFEAGAGVRTPAALVLHMTGLLAWVRDQYEPGVDERLEQLPFDQECARFLRAIGELDRIFEVGLEPAPEPGFDRLWRGPLTDVMTHVGQLATLRRLSGDPVSRVRYWQVDMPSVR